MGKKLAFLLLIGLTSINAIEDPVVTKTAITNLLKQTKVVYDNPVIIDTKPINNQAIQTKTAKTNLQGQSPVQQQKNVIVEQKPVNKEPVKTKVSEQNLHAKIPIQQKAPVIIDQKHVDQLPIQTKASQQKGKQPIKQQNLNNIEEKPINKDQNKLQKQGSIQNKNPVIIQEKPIGKSIQTKVEQQPKVQEKPTINQQKAVNKDQIQIKSSEQAQQKNNQRQQEKPIIQIVKQDLKQGKVTFEKKPTNQTSKQNNDIIQEKLVNQKSKQINENEKEPSKQVDAAQKKSTNQDSIQPKAIKQNIKPIIEDKSIQIQNLQKQALIQGKNLVIIIQKKPADNTNINANEKNKDENKTIVDQSKEDKNNQDKNNEVKIINTNNQTKTSLDQNNKQNIAKDVANQNNNNSGDNKDLFDNQNFFPQQFSFPEVYFKDNLVYQTNQFGSNDIFSQNCPLPRKFIKGQCSCGFGFNYAKEVSRCLPNTQQVEQGKAFRNKFKNTYRAIDGHQNNKKHIDWGTANSRMGRMVSSSYSDEISKPVANRPNPRIVSNQVGKVTGPIPLSKYSLSNLFTIWGQFVDHDVTMTPAQKGVNAEKMNIEVPKGDPNFDPLGTGTQILQFTRSIFEDKSSPRQQKNVITAWLDGSQVYGSDQTTSYNLRSFEHGKLKVDNNNFMPINQNNQFIAGDVRANQNMILSSLHTIFVREHNRIADIIEKSDPRLQDQEIYQLSRMMVIAELSKVTYDDWLPSLLGPQVYKQYLGQYKGYNKNENPNIVSEFSSAFRLGHALLVDQFPMINKKGETERTMKLAQMFFNPNELRKDQNMQNILRGVTRSKNKEKTPQIIDSVRNLLFTAHDRKNIIQDLFCLNIQRGRDHGVKDYNSIREFLGFGKITNFSELSDNAQTVQKLSNVYQSVDNLDLWVGVVSEKQLPQAVLGRVGATVVAKQLKKIRDGDRYWYERIFPKKVIDSIKKTTLGQIIRRNTNIKDMQNDVFHHYG